MNSSIIFATVESTRRRLPLGCALALLAGPPLAQEPSRAPGPPDTGSDRTDLAEEVAWEDFDGDGRLDALALMVDGRLELLANRTDGFENVTVAVGLGTFEGVHVASWGDFDADERPDLFLATSGGGGTLLKNDGVSFVDVTVDSGIVLEEPVRDVHWLDEDGDGRLDLHVVSLSSNRVWRGLENGLFEPIELPLTLYLPVEDLAGASVPSATVVTGADEQEIPSSAQPVQGSDADAPLRSVVRISESVTSHTAAGGGGALDTMPLQMSCLPTLRDQAVPNVCLTASSEATLGSLYPLSSKLFVDEATGNVGMGTTTPSAGLEVQSSRGFVATGGAGPIPAFGSGDRMMWYPGKRALRAGRVTGSHWDDVNIGHQSAALGRNTTASGASSVALGDGTTASGPVSFSVGLNAVAGGEASIAAGSSTTASGAKSTALGSSTTASETSSTALGSSTTASGAASTAMGSGTTATGPWSTSMGFLTTASGRGSLAVGLDTKAEGYANLALGRYNVGGGAPNSWVSTDPIFEIGIGGSDLSRHNAVTVLKNGNTGIGTSTPTHTLDISGDLHTTGFLATGLGPIPATGAGSRMMWHPTKSAFRSGSVTANQWDDANVGEASIAAGRSTKASGAYSAAFGLITTASGTSSTATGYGSTASGARSTAMGSSTTASGVDSVAMGSGSTASGARSTAMGAPAKAESYADVALGRYNVGGGTPGSWVATDPVFEIGNGTGDLDRANALTVLKNGNLGVGTAAPQADIEVRSPSGNADLFMRSAGATDGFNVGVSSTPKLYIAKFDGTTYTDIMTINGADGRVGIGDASPDDTLDVVGGITCVALTQTSDARYKREIRGLKDALERALALRGVSYEWNPETFAHGDDRRHLGFLAQEVREVLPEAVSEDEDGMLSVSYASVVPLLVEALREESSRRLAGESDLRSEKDAEIDALRIELSAMRQQLAGLRRVVEESMPSSIGTDESYR